MDYSKLSDAALEQIASGKPVDYSKLSDADLEAIAAHEQAPAAPVAAAAATDKGFGPTADGSIRNPLQTDWLGAIKNEITKKPSAGSLSVGANPLMNVSAPAGAIPAVAENLAMKAATSPLPRQVSDATNMVGHAKGIAGMVAKAIGAKLPASGMADLATGVAGRVAAYKNPWTVVPQAVSDAAKGVQVVQKGASKLLDAVPSLPAKAAQVASGVGGAALAGNMASTFMGKPAADSDKEVSDKILTPKQEQAIAGSKFAPALDAASKRSQNGFAATHFILQQSNPEYQELLKKASE